MSRAKNSERNCAIFIAYGLGETIGSLCEKHGLKPTSVYAIILAERHRRAFSPHSIYAEAQGQGIGKAAITS